MYKSEPWSSGTQKLCAMEKRIERAEEEPNQEQAEDDPILDLAIEYVVNSAYPTGISKEKKKAMRKRAAKLLVEDGDAFLRKKNRKVTENRQKYLCLLLQ